MIEKRIFAQVALKAVIGVLSVVIFTACSEQDQASPVAKQPNAAVSAGTKTIVLPAEDLEFSASSLPGRQLAVQKCTICHSVDYILYQAPDLSLEKWTAEVQKMHLTYGAPLNEEDISAIGAYLAVAYGSAKADDADVVTASAVSVPTPTETGAADSVQNLLQNNACLGCHAIDSKLVGPSYREVAERYKGDAEAKSKIAANIKAGGTGKWGQIPMPAMPTLSDAQLQQLAEFVLQQ